MSLSRKKQISYALLLCMAFIIFPMNALHAHEMEETPCHDHFDLAVDSCHVSIYHDASELEHCDHKEHVVDSEEDCDLCDVVTSRKIDFSVPDSNYDLRNSVEQSNHTVVHEAAQQKVKNTLQGRAPPLSY